MLIDSTERKAVVISRKVLVAANAFVQEIKGLVLTAPVAIGGNPE